MQALNGVRYLASSTVKQAVSELSFPVPWGEIRGRVWGPDHGRPVLCLHGWSDNCGSFNKLIPLLPRECRYVAVDLAGHGLSSHRPPGVFYQFPYYVMDMLRVVDVLFDEMRFVKLTPTALQWRRFSIIGHSMGGNVAGLFSALYPEMVNGIVLLDSFGFLPAQQKEISGVMRKGFDQMLQFEKTTKEEKNRVYTYENAVERLMAANTSLSEQSARILLERGLVPVEGGFEFCRDFRINLTNIIRFSLEQGLEMQSKIKAPILIVLADEGFEKIFNTPTEKKMIAALLQGYKDKNNTIVTVPGDHHIHLNKPEVVAPLVSDFLRTTVLSPTDGHSSKL